MKNFKEIAASIKTSYKQEEGDASLPVKGGRVSISDNANTLGNFFNGLALTNPSFNIQALKALENLAQHHPEVSKAVENIVTLANTERTITFKGVESETQEEEMLRHLNKRERTWYSHSSSSSGLVNDLLAQTVVYGALSAEIVPRLDLTGVDKVVTVNPKYIRFNYDNEIEDYKPYQLITNSILAYTKVPAGAIELNTLTYKYIPIRRLEEKPYGIPPFLAAIPSLSVGKDMKANLAFILKKVGVMGFLEVLVNAPKRMPNEKPEDYYTRTQKYLQKVSPEIQKGMNKGYVVGFKDRHEFNLHSVTNETRGTKDLFELNDKSTFAGLKQDPILFGRNFSTTETFARVILATMNQQVKNYQSIVADFLAEAYRLELLLSGYSVGRVNVDFASAVTGDQQKKETATKTKLENLIALKNMGVISIQQLANEMGYDSVYNESKSENEPKPASNPEEDSSDDNGTEPDKSLGYLIPFLERANYSSLPVFEYYNSCNCESCTETSKQMFAQFAQGDDLTEFVRKYYTAVSKRYTKAYKGVAKQIANYLTRFTDSTSLQEITDAVFYVLYTNWPKSFNKQTTPVISKYVRLVYRFFRNDKSIFNSVNIDVPNGVFNTIDKRALKYYEKIDSVYLGKFITDPDVKKDITEFIKEQYLTRNLPLNGDISEFVSKFGKVLSLKEWKIRQIVDTTVSRMRNSAAVAYMEQAGVETYEIRGVVDRLQCGYCKELQGKKFEVSRAVKSLENTYNSEPEYIGLDSPFITAIFKKPSELEELTGKDLQDKNFNLVPAHPHCRDVVVPLID